MSGPITIGSPPIGGGNYDHEIRQLSQQLQALQRVMDGMSPQTIVDAEGTAYDIIGRYMGTRDIGSERLPFEIFTRGNAIVAHPGIVGFDKFPETTEEEAIAGTWFFEVRVSIDGETGEILETIAEWTTTPTSGTATDYAIVIGKIDVTGDGPDSSTIEQYNFGPIQVTLYGGIFEKWNVILY